MTDYVGKSRVIGLIEPDAAGVNRVIQQLPQVRRLNEKSSDLLTQASWEVPLRALPPKRI